MNFKKLMLSSLLIMSSALSAPSHAQDHIGWGNPNQPPSIPGQPIGNPWDQHETDPWGNSGSQARNVELQVNQYFQNGARLNLLQDSYIRMQLQGQRVQELILTASTEQGNGQARLLINGQALEGAQTVARQMRSYRFRVDTSNLRSLELEMRGRFYVEKAVFTLSQISGPVNPGPGIPSGPQTEVVRQQLSETIQTEGGLQLFRMFNLANERQGQGVRRITVLARAQSYGAIAQLLVNDQNSGISQSINTSSQRLTFELSGQRIGREIQGLRLYFRGNVLIEEVSIEFDRAGSVNPGPGPGPILESRIEQVVNQRLYETNGISLAALMRIDSRQLNRIVDSVELVLRNSDYGARVKLCQMVQGQNIMNCGNITTLNPGSQIVRLSSVNFARLSEVNLSVRMGMIDIDRIIINLR